MINIRQYRPCVAMLIIKKGRVLLFKRADPPYAWQVPQGGIDKNEKIEEAMWRELKEETSISPTAVQLVSQTQDYIYYTIPRSYRRHSYIGQKQMWFLLQMTGTDKEIALNQTAHPEFIHWKWVSYWHTLASAVSFKREVYRQALQEFLPMTLRLGI